MLTKERTVLWAILVNDQQRENLDGQCRYKLIYHVRIGCFVFPTPILSLQVKYGQFHVVLIILLHTVLSFGVILFYGPSHR